MIIRRPVLQNHLLTDWFVRIQKWNQSNFPSSRSHWKDDFAKLTRILDRFSQSILSHWELDHTRSPRALWKWKAIFLCRNIIICHFADSYHCSHKCSQQRNLDWFSKPRHHRRLIAVRKTLLLTIPISPTLTCNDFMTLSGGEMYWEIRHPRDFPRTRILHPKAWEIARR